MKEPLATWTNLAYILLGAHAAFTGNVPEGLAMVSLGGASGMYHWTLDPFWQHADEVMMYVTLSVIIGGYFGPIGYAVAGALSIFFVLEYDRMSSHLWVPIFSGLGFAVMLVERTFRYGDFWLGLQDAAIPLAVALVAVGVRSAGEKAKDHKWMKDHGIMHGFWHISTSIALRLFVR